MPRRHFRVSVFVALALVALAGPTSVSASTPVPFSLVADLEDDTSQRDSEAQAYTIFDGWAWFVASDRSHGSELWRTDGSQVERMTDTCPGPCDAGIVHLVPFGEELLLFLRDSHKRSRLEAIDRQGTLRRITEIGSGLWREERPIVLGDRLVFAARRPTAGFELWTSDATRDGTGLLADLCPGTCSSFPRDFFHWNDHVYFSAETPDIGRELWRTDGTVEGTEWVLETNPGPDNGNPQALGVVAGRLLFRAIEPDLGVELWATDGEDAELLADLAPGFGSSWPSALFQNGEDSLYLTTLSGPDAWKTDGTAAGTQLAPELTSNGEPPLSHGSVLLGEHFLYQTLGAPGTLDLWAFDLAGLSSTRLASGLRWAQVGRGIDGEGLFLRDGTGGTGQQLWATDGTVSGTRLLHSFDVSRRFPDDFTVLGSQVIFSVDDTSGIEPWITDGTSPGTRLLADVHRPLNASDPAATVRLGEHLYTVAGPARRVWRIDSSGLGVALSSPEDGAFERLIATPNRLYAIGRDGRPWALDGQATGLLQLHEDATAEHAAVGDRLYFARISTQELWRTDGTPESTVLVVELFSDFVGCQILCPDPPPIYPRQMVGIGDDVFFLAIEEDLSLALWRSDGTPDGTQRVAGPTPAILGHALVHFGDALAFVARDDDQVALWSSDGLDSRLILSFPPEVQALQNLTASGSGLAFAVVYNDERHELWASDGSAAGTRRLSTLGVGDGSQWAVVDEIVDADGQLFVSAWNDLAGEELWASDGTPEGTILLDLWPGRFGSGAAGLTPLGARAVFAAASPDAGTEPWISDGTAAGTSPIGDLFPGPDSAAPTGFLVSDERVVFHGDDGSRGHELFSFVPPAPGEPCGPFELCLHAGRFRVTISWIDFLEQTGHGQPLPFSSNDSGLFWFFDAANWEMLVKVLDGCGTNGHYWVFAAATTNVAYTLTVTDTSTDESVFYRNPLGQASPATTDTMAFATCP